jgi:uncharacterized protein
MNQTAVSNAMSDPAFYLAPPQQVELIQTHISRVFIAGDEVYKVKKSVDFGFLDFTTLEKRKFYCEEEVRLNRRLAPQVYLGVVEISLDHDGKLVLGKGETVVEYAVHMNKIPADKMLKKLLLHPDFDPSVMTAVARKLVRFHREAETGDRIDETGGIDTVQRNHEENFSQTEPFIGMTLSSFRHNFIRSYARKFLLNNEGLFLKRVRDHKIRDCHGDLHLEHIVVTENDIIIFDCIEFNERFRFGDIAAEVAFLAMDLDFNGYGDLSQQFVQSYIDESADQEIACLIPFYKCYYAYVRGKVTGFRLHDPHISPEDRHTVTAAAAKYFNLALSYAFSFRQPTLILMSGLMGSGKSVTARALSQITRASVIQMDVIRKELFDIHPRERRLDDFGQGIYSEDLTDLVYKKSLASAKEMLEAGKSVIIDASYKREAHRLAAYDMAKSMKADFFVLECVCPDQCARDRLARRIQDKKEASDGRLEIYDAQKDDFDAISEFSPAVHLRLDASGKLEDCVDQSIAFMTGTATAE